MSTKSFPTFDSLDPLGIDSLYTDDEFAVRDTVRGFCAEQITPHIADWFEPGELPGVRELAREFG